MRLGTLREISPFETFNSFSLVEASGDAGSVVEFVSYDKDNQNGVVDYSLSPYAGTASYRYGVLAKVQLATSGAGQGKVAGIMLKDVREYDELGRRLILYPGEAAARDLIMSGQAVPLVKRGVIEVGGYEGTAGLGSGAKVSNSGGGVIAVASASLTVAQGRIGTFLTNSGKQGTALLQVDINY